MRGIFPSLTSEALCSFPYFTLYRRKILNRHLNKLFYSISLLILSGCAATTINSAVNKGATVLNTKDIFSLVSNNTLHLVSSDFDAYLFLSENGKLSAKSVVENNLDYGEWDIKSDNRICLKYAVWYYGDVHCYSAYKDAGQNQYLLFTENGSLAFSSTVFPGNPKHLKIKSKKDGKTVFVRSSLRKGQSPESTSAASAPAPTVEPADTNTDPGVSREEVKHTVKHMAQDCPGCNFEDSDLRKANLIGANLKGANLRGADLSRANLRRANLEGADLSGATLLSTNLPGANLKNADLSGADLSGSNLIRADFSGADLNNAILDNTLQEGVRGLK